MNEPVLDQAALDKLEEWGGKELVGKMIQLFLEHAPQRVEQIRGAGAGALEQAEMGAHSLKSSAANLGARRLRLLAAEIEERAADGDARAVSELLPPLEEAYRETEAALTELSGLGEPTSQPAD